MDRASSLAGAYAKLDRADEHFQSLEREIQAWVQNNEDAARGQLQLIDGQTFYVMEARTISTVPVHVGLVLGDAVHNLRAALDHAIWQVVTFHKGKPDRGNQFPIFTREPTTEQALAKWNRNVRGIGNPDLALIKGVQPYVLLIERLAPGGESSSAKRLTRRQPHGMALRAWAWNALAIWGQIRARYPGSSSKPVAELSVVQARRWVFTAGAVDHIKKAEGRWKAAVRLPCLYLVLFAFQACFEHL